MFFTKAEARLLTTTTVLYLSNPFDLLAIPLFALA